MFDMPKTEKVHVSNVLGVHWSTIVDLQRTARWTAFEHPSARDKGINAPLCPQGNELFLHVRLSVRYRVKGRGFQFDGWVETPLQNIM